MAPADKAQIDPYTHMPRHWPGRRTAMNILCNIDQAEAMRRGINAPSSTDTVEVDPALLTEIERQVVAAVMTDGHDCTRTGLSIETDQIVAGLGGPHLLLVRPDLQGLRDAIAVLIAARDAHRAKWLQDQANRAKEIAKNAAACQARCAKIMADPLTRREALVFVATHPNHQFVAHFPIPGWPEGVANSWWKEHAAEYANEMEQIQAEMAKKKEEQAARVATENAFQTARAAQTAFAEEEAQTIEWAQWNTVYARLPGALRERDAAGYATSDEITKAIRGIIRSDHGYESGISHWQGSAILDSLTDEEFAKLKVAQQSAPIGASVEAKSCWDWEYEWSYEEDKLDDWEEYDDTATESGQRRFRYRKNEVRQIVINWRYAGIKIVAVLPL
jgi:hypothetical protein